VKISEMLTYRRAHDSAGEREFIARYIAPVAAPVAAPDGTIHAYTVTIGTGSRLAFCAHTDSVHNRQNPATRQPVAFDGIRGEYIVGDKNQRDCLGADNAAGCYVLLKMIAARVPGLYVFFRGEERGGIGSRWIAENRAGMFARIDAAIQFDRRDTKSIITHMAVGRTCSDEFARSLADTLAMGHELDDTGSFTDTANLAGIIPECTNVSVGYDFEHSAQETLRAEYLERLARACVATFKNSPRLAIARVPGAFDDGGAMDLLDMSDEDIEDMIFRMSPSQITDLVISLRDELETFSFGRFDMEKF